MVSDSVNGLPPVQYAYDGDGLLIQSGGLTLHRDPDTDLLTGSTVGGVTGSWTYNGFGEPVGYEALFEGSPIYAYQLERDLLGRIVRKTETLQGVTTVWADSGELLSKTRQDQTTAYNDDEFGNLVAVDLPDGTLIEYVVDGTQRRVAKKVDGTLVEGYLYRDETSLVARLDSDKAVAETYSMSVRPNTPAVIDASGARQVVLSDHLGTPRALLNPAGELSGIAPMSAAKTRVSFRTLRLIEISLSGLTTIPVILLIFRIIDWNKYVTVLGSAALLALVGLIFRPLYRRRLPDTSDQEFLAQYRARFDPPYDRVLAEREALADVLGIPRTKIGLDARLGNIKKGLGLLDRGDYEIGLSDLIDDLVDRLGRKRIESLDFDEISAGEIIRMLIRLANSPPLS